MWKYLGPPVMSGASFCPPWLGFFSLLPDDTIANLSRLIRSDTAEFSLNKFSFLALAIKKVRPVSDR